MSHKEQKINKPRYPNLHKAGVGSSGLSLTELRFREVFSQLPNGCDKYENGKRIVVYTLHRIIDNEFSLSYHLEFPQKGVQFNFWFDKISYLNSNESVTISFHNRNEKFEKDRLKNILKTSCLTELKTKINDLFNKHK